MGAGRIQDLGGGGVLSPKWYFVPGDAKRDCGKGGCPIAPESVPRIFAESQLQM